MNLEFTAVEYDGDLEDAESEQLRSLISEYESAQEENAAEFEAAKEQIDEIEDVDVEQFHDARSELIEQITEFDSFEASPVEEDDLEAAEFAKLREHETYFAELDATDEEPEDDEGAEFDDMGREGEVTDPDAESEFDDTARSIVGGVAGVNLD